MIEWDSTLFWKCNLQQLLVARRCYYFGACISRNLRTYSTVLHVPWNHRERDHSRLDTICILLLLDCYCYCTVIQDYCSTILYTRQVHLSRRNMHNIPGLLSFSNRWMRRSFWNIHSWRCSPALGVPEFCFWTCWHFQTSYAYYAYAYALARVDTLACTSTLLRYHQFLIHFELVASIRLYCLHNAFLVKRSKNYGRRNLRWRRKSMQNLWQRRFLHRSGANFPGALCVSISMD